VVEKMIYLRVGNVFLPTAFIGKLWANDKIVWTHSWSGETLGIFELKKTKNQ